MDLPVREKLPHTIPQWVADGSWFFITINCVPQGKNQLCHADIGNAVLRDLTAAGCAVDAFDTERLAGENPRDVAPVNLTTGRCGRCNKRYRDHKASADNALEL